ncbi:MAG: SCP2 sterol-binding domain-containing protein [Betaproteobacteria bacterium]|nr:SCP2 sterol-binding domain-containing protein [Betaproteobacteria bacterium]
MQPLQLPDFTLPPRIARLGRRLPQLPPTLALIGALNLALGRVLPREPLTPLRGKRLAIRVSDAGLNLCFTLDERGFRPSFGDAAADLTITARARDFLALLMREEDADTLFFKRRLQMQGETEMGLLVKNTLDAIELPRFELSRFTPLRDFRQWRWSTRAHDSGA